MVTRYSTKARKALLLIAFIALLIEGSIAETVQSLEGSEGEDFDGPVLLNKEAASASGQNAQPKLTRPQPKTLSGANTLSKVIEELLKRVAESQTEEDYQVALSNYERFKAQNKEKGVCLPRAPQRRLSTKATSLIRKDCSLGYRVGWRHGKRWAHIIVRNGDQKAVGRDKVECLLNSLEPNHVEARHVCAVKGALAGYERWYTRLTDAKEKLNFERMREAEPSPLVELRRPVREEMNPEETEYARAFQLHNPNN